jgi:hypothetical protein
MKLLDTAEPTEQLYGGRRGDLRLAATDVWRHIWHIIIIIL